MRSKAHRGRMAAALAALILTAVSLAGTQSAFASGAASVTPVKVTILGPDGRQHASKAQPYDTTNTSIAVKIAVANTGSIDVDHIAVTGTSAVTCPATSLAAGDSMNCTAQLMADAHREFIGQVDVKAVDSQGVKLLAGGLFYGRSYAEPILTVYVVNSYGGAELIAGDGIDYTGTVTNPGPTAAQNIRTTFFVNKDNIPMVCPRTTLQAGESMTCHSGRPYIITPADVGPGRVIATFMAETEPLLPAITGTASSVLVAKENAAGAKAATPSGEPVTWDYTVLNTGDVTLTDVSVVDDRLAAAGIAATCPATSLAPGDHMVCHGTQTPEPGRYTNTVTVSTAQGAGDSDSWAAMIVDAGIGLTKTATVHPADTARDHQDVAQEGDTIDYAFEVTNSGNVALDDVALSDAMLDDAHVQVTCPATSLAVGGTMTCTSGAYTVTKTDAERGKVVNTATVTGTPDTDTAYPDVTATAGVESATQIAAPTDDPTINEPPLPTDEPTVTEPAATSDPTDPATTAAATSANPTVAATAKAGSASKLAFTGGQVLPLAALTVAALAVGGVLLLARRRLGRGTR